MVPRNNPTLREAFESTFHNKYSFDEFLISTASNETEEFFISKRSVYKTSTKLKKFLRFLNSFVFDYADINSNVVHSYRKGKSPYTAVKSHTQSKYFFKTDISNFFYNIDFKAVEKILDVNLGCVPISDIELYKEQLLKLITIKGHLPVGLPTSPSITNTYLVHFDNALEDYCSANNIIYTRYSDDIILSCNTQQPLNSASAVASQYLSQFTTSGLRLNPHKTKYYHRGNRVKLLGMVILPNGEITVDSTLKKEIEALLHFYTTDQIKYRDYLDKNFKNSATRVSGSLNYINTVDKDFLDKLRRKYGNFSVDHFFSNPED